VPDLREQISRVANRACVQPSHCTLSDTSQVQPGQSDKIAVSETCASNSSCVFVSVETECSHGMNGNVLNGNVCLLAPMNVSVPTTGGKILPELALPTFSSREHNAVNSLKVLAENLKLKSLDERLKLTLLSKSLREKFVKIWFMATKEHINSYEEFKIKFWINFGVSNRSHAQGYRFIDVGMIRLQTAQYGFTSFEICYVKYITTILSVGTRIN